MRGGCHDVTWKYMPTSTIQVFAKLSTVVFLTLNVDASCAAACRLPLTGGAWHGPLTSVNNYIQTVWSIRQLLYFRHYNPCVKQQCWCL